MFLFFSPNLIRYRFISFILVNFLHPASRVFYPVFNGLVFDPVFEIKCENINRRERLFRLTLFVSILSYHP
jgi:hypothetical protein